MKLANEIVAFRALEPADVELLYRWENDVDVWRVSNLHQPLSRFDLAAYIKAAPQDIWERKELRLVIELLKGSAVGTIELFDFDPYHSRAGVGIMIYEQEQRRKGVAGAALELLIAYAENELGITHLYASIAANNQASLALFEKLGFERTGTRKKWLRTPAGWNDEYFYQRVR